MIESKGKVKTEVSFEQFQSWKTENCRQHRKIYLTAFAVTPPPREAATSAQNWLDLSKLTCFPMAMIRIVFSDSLVQVYGIAWVKNSA